MRHSLAAAAVALALTGLGAGQSRAEPILQLYLEGGTYDSSTETWVLTPSGSSAGAPFRLWAIGNTAGTGSAGTIQDVRLSVAYDAAYKDLQITLTPTTTGGYGGFTDPSVPSTLNGAPRPSHEVSFPVGNDTKDVGFIQTSGGLWDVAANGPVVTDGSGPVLSTGKSLPQHGVFGLGTAWQEFYLDDFSLFDSPIADFINAFPTAMKPDKAQINVYEVRVTGDPSASGAVLHFDLYNHIEGTNKAKFAPFSHDVDGEAHIVPAPSSLVGLLSMALAAGLALAWRRRKAVR